MKAILRIVIVKNGCECLVFVGKVLGSLGSLLSIGVARRTIAKVVLKEYF
jgi:hypothetical protein